MTIAANIFPRQRVARITWETEEEGELLMTQLVVFSNVKERTPEL